MSLEELSETVWESWRDGRGPCAGCQNRDCNGHFRPRTIDPGTVSGDPDPELVLLADAPSDTTPQGNKRRQKNTATAHWDNRAESIAEEAEAWTPAYEFLTDDRIPDWFFETELGYTPEPDGGIFYATSKKCADIEGNDPANRQARRQCVEYLKEQLAILDPEAILAFGNTPMDQLAALYEFDRRASITGEALETVYREAVTIVPSLHWQAVKYRPTRLPQGLNPEWYWKKLASIVRKVLSGGYHVFHEFTAEMFDRNFEPMTEEEFLEMFGDEDDED